MVPLSKCLIVLLELKDLLIRNYRGERNCNYKEREFFFFCELQLFMVLANFL